VAGLVKYPPADPGSSIAGWIDGRYVEGNVTCQWPWADGPDDGFANGAYHWYLQDNSTVADLTWYNSTQVVSDMYGKFQLMNDNGDGVWQDGEYWVMTVDYLTYYWDNNLGRYVLNEDYLCFYAVDTDNDGTFWWIPPDPLSNDDPDEADEWVDWETWMTEQWHTIPDLYTDISIDQGTDEDKWQLYMLTSSWYSDQSQLRIPYYEDGAIRSGQEDWYEFYVPEILFTQPTPVTIEIFLYWTHDIQNLDLELYDGNRTALIANSNMSATSQEVISFPANHSGKYWVRINGTLLVEDLAPEAYELYIEVRGQGARVKFWYDPENCDDIYVSTTDKICGVPDICPCRKGDIDKDCYIGPLDLTGFADAWGKSLGEQGYSDCFDMDNSGGTIDPIDLTIFADHWGEHYCDPSCDGHCIGDWQEWP